MFIEKVKKFIAKAESQAVKGSGAIGQGLFDEARTAFGSDGIVKQSHGLIPGDLAGYFTHAAIGVGTLAGMYERLKEMQLASVAANSASGTLSQTAAFPLVDLWTRSVGARALLLQLCHEIETFESSSSQLPELKARMGSVFDVLEFGFLQLTAELAMIGALSVVGEAVDRSMVMVRSEQRGAFGTAVPEYIHSLVM